MDQNTPFDPMHPSGQDQNKVPPPPPSYDQQVGVRSMASDMQSIQQSGGESPQSKIYSANEVFGAPKQDSPFTPPSAPTVPVPPPPQVSGQQQEVIMEPPAHSSVLKTILTIIGIVIVAAGVGYGVYYLVNSLNATPSVPVIPAFSPSPMASPVSESSPSPVVGAGTHTSVILNPSSSETLTLTAVALNDFKTALNALSARDSLLVGTIKDVSFVDSAGMFVTSQQLLNSFFPTAAPSVSFLFQPDFSAWMYGDKTGGNKFGVILEVKPEVSFEQLTSALALLEGNPSELANMFLGTVGSPSETEFSEAPIGDVPVRYLAYSTAKQQVFEYAPVGMQGKTYVVIATSFYQMQHILGLLDAQPAQ